MAGPESSNSSSVELVISNNDLLTEILIRLPVVSLVLFKLVSKTWNSLITDYSSNLTLRRNLDPPSALFIQKIKYPEFSFSYEFVQFDIRIPLLATSFTHVYNADIEILQSSNGLLLCRSTLPEQFYVYNPSVTNMFKLIPEPDNVTFNDDSISGGLRLAFDPTKSPHYKVVYGHLVTSAHPLDTWIQMHTYSSETRKWSLCGHHFPPISFNFFWCGVYWNDAIYWVNFGDKIFKLDIMNEHPVFTALQPPLTLHSNIHNKRRLFVSRGCLLLFGMQNVRSQHITIFEKSNVHSESWSVKYIVNLDDIIKPFPKESYEYPRVFCILLGEREEDFVLVMELDKTVVQYKIAAKTVDTISALGPNDHDVTCFEFIPYFANA